MKRIGSLTALAVLAGGLIGGPADARIEGPLRERLLALTENSCQARAVQSSSVLTPDMAQAYCSCLTEYVVDNVTIDQLQQSYAGVAPGTQPALVTRLFKSGIQHCLLNIKQYYHGATPAAAGRSDAAPERTDRPRGPQTTYLVPDDHAAAAPVSSRPEECSQYVLKVVTDRSQSVCRAK